LGDLSLTNPENFMFEESITTRAGNAGSLTAGAGFGGNGNGGGEYLPMELAA